MYLNSSISTIESRPVVQVPGIKPVSAETGTHHETDHAARQKHAKTEKIAELQTVLSNSNISMKFSENEQTNQVVVQLVDDRTGDLIRQIPNDVSLKLAAANIKLQGHMLDETV